jgi:hypothetical protein
MFFVDEEVDQENANGRILETGSGAEAIRRYEIEELKGHLAAFSSHASLADLVALNAAFRLREQIFPLGGSAPLLEAFWMLRQPDVASPPNISKD